MSSSSPDIVLAIHRKLSKRIESGRGVALTANELVALVQVGAFQTVANAATDYQVRKCQERNARSRSISEVATDSIDAEVGQTSRSSGTMPIEAANEALAQARAMCGKPA